MGGTYRFPSGRVYREKLACHRGVEMRRILKSLLAGSLLLFGGVSVLPAQTPVWWDTSTGPAPLEAAPSEDPALEEFLQLLPPTTMSAATCSSRSGCCRVCDKGKACGNSCISRKFVCHKGRGCACDSGEVCR